MYPTVNNYYQQCSVIFIHYLDVHFCTVNGRGGGGQEAEFLDEIQTKVLRVYLRAMQSHFYTFALRFYFLKLTQPLTVSTVQLL